MRIRSKYLLRLRPVLLASAVFLAPQVFARDVIIDPIYEYRDEVGRGEFSYDDSKDIPWIENETEVLGLPEAEDLIKVDLDQLAPGLTLMVDKSRVSVNPDDRVVRVWLWVSSRSGAENGSFEGFRCETREFKVYAHGNGKRTPPVSKVKQPRWRGTKSNTDRNYRRELMDEYLCGFGESRDEDKVRQYLSGGEHGDRIFADY